MASLTLQGQHVLHDLLEKNKQALSPVIENTTEYEVQIIYTQIDRDQQNIPHFKTYTYNLNDHYFYPASTIKMPIAFAALEKINQLKIKGLNKHSVMKHGIGSPPQTNAAVDTSAKNGLASVAHYIKKIFLVSDNDANNRLYEFVGQARLNQSLHQKGFEQTRLIHRLGASGAAFSIKANQLTNPVSFYEQDKLLYHQGEVHSKAHWNFEVKEEQKGKGFMYKEQMYHQAFDFSKKNYIALRDLHDMLQAVIFPEGVPTYRQFNLTPDDYQFLYHWMSARPRSAQHPYYDEPDGYVKFFMYGGAEEKIPEHIKIFNKVGYAYGYLTDVAYIIDTEAKLEFLLAATVHVNANQIYNDNVYEYDTVGLPFLAKLGNIIYNFERTRPRKFLPDFSKFLD